MWQIIFDVIIILVGLFVIYRVLRYILHDKDFIKRNKEFQKWLIEDFYQNITFRDNFMSKKPEKDKKTQDKSNVS